MKVVVISSTDKYHTEIPAVLRMFQLGLRHFHLRKPKWSTEKLEEYLKEIPEQYHPYIIIHSHHKLVMKYNLKGIHLTRKHRKKGRKMRFRIRWYRFRRKGLHVSRTFHKLSDLVHVKGKFDYVFLTPIYDGISKNSHSGGFSQRALEKMLTKTDFSVYAMGGVGPDKIKDLHAMGFDGACLLGSIWEQEGDKTAIYRDAMAMVKEINGENAPDDIIA